jgi:Ferritin-like
MDGRYFTPDALVLVPTGRDKRLTPAGVAEPRNADDGLSPLHDPPLAPRHEAVFLLTAAAEIEHALMVQYLFAAYSVHVEPGGPAERQVVANLLTEIAREEMGQPRHRAESASPDRRLAQPQSGPGSLCQ